jgi:hexulose-6-phosphate isomerase
MLEVASWLGVDTILVVPGAVDVFFKPDFPVVPYDLVYERSFQALKELTPFAESYKVNIAIENVWNKFLLSPVEMKHFIDSIGSPYVGVYFDVGNVLRIGLPEQWIKIYY